MTQPSIYGVMTIPGTQTDEQLADFIRLCDMGIDIASGAPKALQGEV